MDAKEALQMLEDYQAGWQEIYDAAKEDQKFFIGEQWTREDKDLRGARPCITVNVLPQFAHQVTNQIRQNTPAINVLPASEGASLETAKTYKGLIRNIEQRSGADEVYDTSAEYSVINGLGYIRVDHDYVSSDSFVQELLIKRVQNPLSWWIDPSSTECDGSDSEGAIGLTTITKEKFEKNYPDKKYISFEKDANRDEKRDSITLAEVYIKEYEIIAKAQAADGKIVDGDKGEKTRKLKKTIIRRYLFSGAETLEESVFPGEYIPIVPVYGQELWVDGKRNLISLIRQAKDPQRRYNHWASVESEILSKAPIAPFVAEGGSIEDYSEDWLNPAKAMVLRYNKVNPTGEAFDRPDRVQPVPVPPGIINAMQGAYEDIKRSMGLYDASVGQKSNETSGVAIDARKDQGDVATFHFADNLNRSIAHVGRILVCAIPVIYDTERVVQIIGEEDEPQMVGINGAPMQTGQEQPYDLSQGKYDVRVTTGPSFTTKRQEASNLLGEAIKATPALMGVIGDLYFKNLDVAGAEAIAARVRKTIPPELTAEEDAKKNGGQAPSQAEIQMQQQMQQMQAEMQEMGAALQEAQAKAQSNEAAMIKAQSDAQAKQQEFTLKSRELELKVAEAESKERLAARELAIKEFEAQTKAEIEAMKLEIAQQKQKLDEEKTNLDAVRIGHEQSRSEQDAAFRAEEISQKANAEKSAQHAA